MHNEYGPNGPPGAFCESSPRWCDELLAAAAKTTITRFALSGRDDT
jgi:hypothetical protein